jgi:hypothetical protein
MVRCLSGTIEEAAWPALVRPVLRLNGRVLGAFWAILFSATASHAQLQTIPTPLYAQLTDMWCWAASGEMTMSYLGNNVPQCGQANLELNRLDCCVPSGQLPPEACIHGGYPQYSAWGFTNDLTSRGTPLTFAQMQQQISLNKPWAFVWKWTAGGGHVMVGTGWALIPLLGQDLRFVYMNNPEPWSGTGDGGKQYWISYDYYVSGKNHTHGSDYYNITKVTP